MAPTPVDLSLASLLPTLSTVPAEVTSLAQSLLSQSRIKAAHLKAEEEVGRTYACCHIAAERLKSKHGLELGKARPPVPPRVYGKLKGFLEGVLAGPVTPKGRLEKDVNVGGSGGGAGRKTPESRPTSMRKKWAEARKFRAAPEVVGTRRGDEGLEVPKYAMPMIRHLCKRCGAEKAVPHVFTGVNVVLKEFGRVEEVESAGTPSGSGRKRKRTTEDGEKVVKEDDVPGVILAVFCCVVGRMYGDERVVEEDYVQAAEEFASMEKHGLPSVAAEEDYFDNVLTRFALEKQKHWTDMEWYGNVPAAQQDNNVNPDSEDEEVQDSTPARKKPAKTPLRRKEKHDKLEEDYDDLGRAGLLPGLGTMFQPAVDWLSDERVAEFERWQREMRQEIIATAGEA